MGRKSALGTLVRTLEPQPPELIDAKEAAAILGCDTRSVHRGAKQGRIPYIPCGTRSYRFRRSVIEQLGQMPDSLEALIDRRIALALRAAAAQLERGTGGD